MLSIGVNKNVCFYWKFYFLPLFL